MATQLFDLTGKIALVSGASRGIGEEIAKLLAEQGAHVIVSSRAHTQNPRPTGYLCQQRGDESLFWACSGHRSGGLQQDRRGEYSRVFFHVC